MRRIALDPIGDDMSGAEQEATYNRALEASLSRVIDFLKFAETKNAALLTFASAWTVAIINLLSGPRVLPEHVQSGLTVALPLFVGAALVALWSFLPRRKLDVFYRPATPSKNLLFFGHVAEMDAGEYARAARERYMPQTGQGASGAYLSDLEIQIAANSKIADGKYTMFNLGAGLVLSAMLVLGLAMIGPALRVLVSMGA